MGIITKYFVHGLPRGMIVAGLGLVIAAGTLWSLRRADARPEIQISPAVNDLGSVSAEGRYPIHYVIRNAGQRNVTILGVSSSCTRAGCVVARKQAPVSLAPGETFEIDATFIAPKEGPFHSGFGLYTDLPDQMAIVLKVKGIATASTDSQTDAIAKSNHGAAVVGESVDR